jgi:hypothetical protein
MERCCCDQAGRAAIARPAAATNAALRRVFDAIESIRSAFVGSLGAPPGAAQAKAPQKRPEWGRFRLWLAAGPVFRQQ